MARLSAVERDALPEDQRRFHDAVKAIRRRPISGPFITLMNSSPDLAARFAHLGHYFHARGQADESILPLRVRTFVSLVGSRMLDSPYEWSAWVGWSAEAGVPQETIDAIRERRPLTQLTQEDQLVLDFCNELVGGDHRLSTQTFGAALAHFGTQGLVELVVTLGYFAMIAIPLNAFEIEMSPAQKSDRKPFAPLDVAPNAISTAAAHVRAPARALIAPALRTSAPRIPLVTQQKDMPAEHQHYFDRIVRTRGWVSEIFQALLHTPDVADRISIIGAFMLYETVLPPATRTLVWLVTARELDCDYVWACASPPARKAGVGEDVIDAVAQCRRPEGASGAQTTLIDFCHQLLRGNHHVAETTYRDTVAHYGVPATVQIAASVGYRAMLGLLANAFELIPNADDRPAL